MIRLYHCAAARSFRALWALEDLGLPYELILMPFPPRALYPDYRSLNPLGTVPVLFDGEHRMTESAAICHYLGAKYGPSELVVRPEEEAFADRSEERRVGKGGRCRWWVFHERGKEVVSCR